MSAMSSVPTFILLWFLSIVQTHGSLDVSTCGKSKGCWFMPPYCTYDSQAGTNCTTVVAWKVDEPYVTLEFDSQIDGLTTSPFSGRYVALAFSKDGFMVRKFGIRMHRGDDSVVECVAKPDGTVGAYVSFNDEKSNVRLVEASVLLTKNTSGEVVNGRLVCRTSRLLHNEKTTGIPTNDNFKFFDLRQISYMLQIAKGRTKVGEGYELGIHSTNDDAMFPWMTKDYVKMSDNVVVSSMKQTSIPRSIQYNMVKVHAHKRVIIWEYIRISGDMIGHCPSKHILLFLPHWGIIQ
uniref:DOMON domain-containing protein n=1 Tax=Romanomermis culicivorax TaxID=13658 RepID=A0A915I3I2_ROMCU